MNLNKPTFRTAALSARVIVAPDQQVCVSRNDLLVLADMADTITTNLDQAVKSYERCRPTPKPAEPQALSSRLDNIPIIAIKRLIEACIAEHGYIPPSFARKLAADVFEQFEAYELQVRVLKEQAHTLRAQVSQDTLTNIYHSAHFKADTAIGLRVRINKGSVVQEPQSNAYPAAEKAEVSEDKLSLKEILLFKLAQKYQRLRKKHKALKAKHQAFKNACAANPPENVLDTPEDVGIAIQTFLKEVPPYSQEALQMSSVRTRTQDKIVYYNFRPTEGYRCEVSDFQDTEDQSLTVIIRPNEP